MRRYLALGILAVSLPAGIATAADVPQAAIDACLRHADAYNNVPPGTAKFNGNVEADKSVFGNPSGSDWRLQIDTTGGVDLYCTVSSNGSQIALWPVQG